MTLILPASNAYSVVNSVELGAIIMATKLHQAYPFKDTPILIITDNEMGTVGILLNLRLNNETISNLATQNCIDSSLDFFLGGLNNVVQSLELTLPKDYLPNPTPIDIKEGMIQRSDIDTVCNANDDVSIFFGFEFWSPGEINNEINAGLWNVKKIIN